MRSFLVLSLPLTASAYCYTRNGTRIANAAYQPCNTTSTSSSSSTSSQHDSACCGINHSGAGETNVANDVCETNGLCQNFEPYDGSNEGAQLWWRQGCTDPTWQSPFCLANVCNGTKYAVDNAPVRNCGDNNWCCGEKTCCDNKQSVFQLAATVGVVAVTPSSTSSSASSSTSPTLTSTSSSPPTPSPNSSSSGLSTAAKAGIGIGAAALVCLLLLIALFFLRIKKQKRAKVALASKSDHPYTDVDAPMGVHEQKYGVVDTYASEVAGPQELPGGNAPLELSERREGEGGAGWELHGEERVGELEGSGGVGVGGGRRGEGRI